MIRFKDKQDLVKTPNCVYEIPCGGCNLTIGETKRSFGTRLEQHRREAEKATQQKIHSCQEKSVGKHSELSHFRPCIQGKSFNQWGVKILEKATGRHAGSESPSGLERGSKES